MTHPCSPVLVIGQLPPPVHGSNVMTQRFNAALDHLEIPLAMVEKDFSATLDQVGRRNPAKLLKIPGLCQRTLKAVKTRSPRLCVYFISVGLPSLMVDCLILALLRRMNIPYVLYFHGFGYRALGKGPSPVRAMVRRALGNALGGMVLGKRLMSDVDHLIPRERLFILPNAVPGDPVPGKPAPGGDFHIIYLSNLIPAKGPMVVLEAARKILARNPNVRFTLAGQASTPEYGRELQQFIHTHELEKKVRLPGPVYGRDKEVLLASADLMIFPTRFPKETFGLVNLEAMQWGIPVISSPVGAIPDIIRHGENGYIVAPEDISALVEKALALAAAPERAREMGKRGQALFSRHYSLEAYEGQIHKGMKFFHDLMEREER